MAQSPKRLNKKELILDYDNNNLSESLREKFASMLDFYDSLDKHLKEVYPYNRDCGTCNKCCCYPYFYMILFTPEFELLQAYIEETKLPVRVRFDKLVSRKLDRRVYFKNWVCPLYNHAGRGCSVYPVRPFSCRVFGAYSTKESRIDGCVFDDQILYNFTDDLPFWNDYVDAVRSFPNPERGYILPESMLWQYPVVEMLMEQEFPFSLAKNYEPAKLLFEEADKRLGYSTAARMEDIMKAIRYNSDIIEKRYKSDSTDEE